MLKPFLVATTAVLGLSACTTPPIEKSIDSVDEIIIRSANKATEAMRELSQKTGNYRIVQSGASMQSNLQAAITAPVASVVVTKPVRSIAESNATIITDIAGASYHMLPRSSTGMSQTTTSAPAVPSQEVLRGGLLSNSPSGLERRIDLRWTGELEELVQKIASETGWRYAAPSGFKVSPVVISINAVDQPAYNVLQDIGAIAGTSADVVVTPSKKTLSIRYLVR